MRANSNSCATGNTWDSWFCSWASFFEKLVWDDSRVDLV